MHKCKSLKDIILVNVTSLLPYKLPTSLDRRLTLFLSDSFQGGSLHDGRGLQRSPLQHAALLALPDRPSPRQDELVFQRLQFFVVVLSPSLNLVWFSFFCSEAFYYFVTKESLRLSCCLIHNEVRETFANISKLFLSSTSCTTSDSNCTYIKIPTVGSPVKIPTNQLKLLYVNVFNGN